MKIHAAAAAALALATTLVLAGCAPTTDEESMPGMDHGSSSAPMSTENADAMFATMMIVHHEQAIEMSDIVLAADGVDPAVVDLAERIKVAQAPEITQLEGWLDDWGVAPEDRDAGAMDHGDGMMSDDDLAALRAADGAEASRLFLEQMIAHHEGAIEMAQTQIDDGSDPDAIALAERIVEDQSTEIQEMRDLLSSL